MGFVYLLKDKEAVVYVGQSKNSDNLNGRIEAHGKNKVFDSFSVEICSDEEMNRVESELIFKYAPMYNRNVPDSLGRPTSGKIERAMLESLKQSDFYKEFMIDFVEIGKHKYFTPEKAQEIIKDFEEVLTMGCVAKRTKMRIDEERKSLSKEELEYQFNEECNMR